jgi:hypothetical protein
MLVLHVAQMFMLCVFFYVRMPIILFIYWGNFVSSDVLYSQVFEKKYIPLPNLNSDDVVMSYENKNFHLPIFVRGWAL